MPTLDLDAPQLGEYVWHAFTDDPSIDAQSRAHQARIDEVIARHLPALDRGAARLLEVAAYRHTTGALIASERGGEFVVTDIAVASLRDGRTRARAQGAIRDATLVVADFHDLPFSDAWFDVVFIASAIHHTRAPEMVLRELLRVVRPGGLVMIENEPCARVCCFHAFVCNEAVSFTPYEAGLHAAGVLPTISAPFWGARAEQLFGMVENTAIPLTLFMDVLAEGSSTLERELSLHALIGPVERELLQLPGRGAALRANVVALLDSIVDRAREGFGERERLLGYRLPSACEVHALAGRVANLLDVRPSAGRSEDWEAEMFGAALRIVVRRHDSPIPRATGLFRREMAVDPDGLVRERDLSGSLAGRLGSPLLPDLYASESQDAMAPWFPPADWQWQIEAHGARSMINRRSKGTVVVPPQSARSILLIRYYAVVPDGVPYAVRIIANGRVVDEQQVVLQETRLVRAFVPTGASEIVIEVGEDDEENGASGRHIRIGVFQLLCDG